MPITIRPYTETDRATVVELWETVFPSSPPWNPPKDDIDRKLKVQRELFLVAVIDDRLVGTAMAGYEGHRGWVNYVAVNPGYRRQGIGAALMQRGRTRSQGARLS